MRLGNRPSDLPVYANDRRATARRELTARNALSPVRLFLGRLRRPSILFAILGMTLLCYLIVQEERRRASAALPRNTATSAQHRKVLPGELAMDSRAKEKNLRKLMASYDGMGGYFLGEEAEPSTQPAYIAPESEEGREMQRERKGVYGSPGDVWSSDVSGIGFYMGGSIDYKLGLPTSEEMRPDRTYAVGGKTPLETSIESLVRRSPVLVFSKTTCPYSRRAKELLSSLKLRPAPYIVEVDKRDDTVDVKAHLGRLTGHSTWPNVIIGGRHIGGSDDLARMHDDGSLLDALHNAGVFVSSGAG